MKKLFTVLSLAFVFVCSCIPLSASASVFDVENFPVTEGYSNHWYLMYNVQENDNPERTVLVEFVNNDGSLPDIVYDNNTKQILFKNGSTDSLLTTFTLSTSEPLTWVSGSKTFGTTLLAANSANRPFMLRYSDIDIYDKDGNLFFQQRPLYQIQRAEKVKVILSTNLLQTVAGTIKIVTLFGVGLVSLVIGLNLFGRVLKVFLT